MSRIPHSTSIVVRNMTVCVESGYKDGGRRNCVVLMSCRVEIGILPFSSSITSVIGQTQFKDDSLLTLTWRQIAEAGGGTHTLQQLIVPSSSPWVVNATIKYLRSSSCVRIHADQVDIYEAASTHLFLSNWHVGRPIDTVRGHLGVEPLPHGLKDCSGCLRLCPQAQERAEGHQQPCSRPPAHPCAASSERTASTST
eukprot:746425-Hanusia_phi.AAC.4